MSLGDGKCPQSGRKKVVVNTPRRPVRKEVTDNAPAKLLLGKADTGASLEATIDSEYNAIRAGEARASAYNPTAPDDLAEEEGWRSGWRMDGRWHTSGGNWEKWGQSKWWDSQAWAAPGGRYRFVKTGTGVRWAARSGRAGAALPPRPIHQ